MDNIKQGTFYQIDIENLGEFKFLFSVNKESKSDKDKYYIESYWNPTNYGLVDFIVGYYTNCVKNEIGKIVEDMSYFIDGARISCESRIESGEDTEGVYEGILSSYFDYTEEQIDNMIKMGDSN